MSYHETDEFLKAAVRAGRLAGGVILRNLGRLSLSEIARKGAADFVTRVDGESEEIIISTIRESFPDHDFLAEESTDDYDREGKPSSIYRWIIDPLDGTTNYIHQYPAFSVSIALEYRDEVILGLVLDPLREELFTAEKGKGAFLNGIPIMVSGVDNMKDALIATGFPFRKKAITERYLDLFRRLFLIVSDLRRGGSAALDLAYVAAGRCDGFFELGLNPWDIAAGSLIIKEAGGVVTDFGGGLSFLKTGNIVAGNQSLHGYILEEVRGVFGDVIDG
jgi:myo-inositol-1(or 4)-monophosphatase